MMPRGGRMYRYPAPQGRGMPDLQVPPGGIMSMPYDANVLHSGVSQAVPIVALATALANAPPDQQRTVSYYQK